MEALLFWTDVREASDARKDASGGKPLRVTEGQLFSLTIVSASVSTLRLRDARDGGPSTNRLDLAGQFAHAGADLVGVQRARSQVGTFGTVEQYMVVASLALATGPWRSRASGLSCLGRGFGH